MIEIILSIQLLLAKFFDPRDIPTVPIVLAIIEHESRGKQYVCREDAGGASRGYMQVWRARSKCKDDSSDYQAYRNIKLGMWILAAQSKWHREKEHSGHDPLEHYCGKGPKCVQFARDIRFLSENIPNSSRARETQ